MNNSKMWLVVKPTVGVPLFLSAVAVGSFAVHVAVLSNTTWVSDFLSGQPLGSGAESAMLPNEDGNVAKASYITADGSKVLLELPDGTLALATIEPGDTLAAVTDAVLPEH